MEETVLIRVILAATHCDYEVEIPTGLNTHAAALLTAQALQARSDGMYIASKYSYLAKPSTGAMLDREKTIRENGVRSGDVLLLI